MKVIMKFLYVAAMIAVLAQPIWSGVDCENDKCRDKGQRHPLCRYKDPEPSPACGNVTEAKITRQEQIEIVNLHNNLRSKVAQGFESRGNPGPQPPAKYMQILTWDYELSEAAQRWVNQCSFTRAPCVNEKRFDVGQTLGFKGPGATASDIINQFYEEVIYMNSTEVESLPEVNDTVKDYVQLVWANTTKIGCGKIISNARNGQWTYLLLCLYGEAGNVLNEPVYEISDDYFLAQYGPDVADDIQEDFEGDVADDIQKDFEGDVADDIQKDFEGDVAPVSNY